MPDARAGEDAARRPARAGSTQRSVRATIARLGGYWRPLAAVARLLEELGELAESIASPRADVDELASELADLWIITTALADQFLGEVAEPGSHPSDRRAPSDLLSALVATAGQIARIVNHYDGPKTPRSLDGWPSLSDAVAAFGEALSATAHAHGVSLELAVADKLRAIAVRDSGRFAAAGHDPSTAACLEQFRLIQTTPWGAQAQQARLWGAPPFSAQALASDVAAIAPTLISFTRAAAHEDLEGYVLTAPPAGPAQSPDDWVRAVLRELARHDPEREHHANELEREGGAREAGRERHANELQHEHGTSGAERLRGTEIVFNGVLLSVTAFSDMHPAEDPRHSPIGTHILLRPSGRGSVHGPR